jgi:hypothetical protein
MLIYTYLFDDDELAVALQLEPGALTSLDEDEAPQGDAIRKARPAWSDDVPP